MKPLLGTLYLLGMLVPRGLGYDRSLAQHRNQVVDKTGSPWKNLETYSYNKYHPMEEIYLWMSQISKKHAEVVTQHLLGMTFENRPMYYLKVSERARRAFLGEPLLHLRVVLKTKEGLYQKCGRNQEKQGDFFKVPQLNNSTDRLWRKSRSSHNNGTCFGSDLNRNFNVSWCSIGASKNCQDLTFCGTEPVSEPETKAVSGFVESKKEDILCFLTIHSYGQLILTPYGYTKNKPSNHEELVSPQHSPVVSRETQGGPLLPFPLGQKAANALKAKHGTNYRVGSSADILYPTSGSSRDWARDIGIPFSYTFELRDNGTEGFLLHETQIQPTCEEAMEAVLSILDDVYAKWLSNTATKVTSTTVLLNLLWLFTSLL
uniref:Carboxypeptidase O n=1 Tax=Marmota marmota marmota TaxID=9994 RepID=A0A8C5ZLD5_MARMA